MPDCDFFPDSPACIFDEDNKGDIMTMEATMDMKRAQYVYLFAAAAASSYSGLNLFRYHAAENYYAYGD